MSFIVDGHNLIGALPDIHLNQPDDEARLLARLRSYRARRGGPKMLVFFDSSPLHADAEGSRPVGGPLSSPGVDVRFAAFGQSADDAIIDFLRGCRQPGQYAVVTNDLGLAARARALGASVLRATEFAAGMMRRTVRGARKAALAGSLDANPRDPAFADLYARFLQADKAAARFPVQAQVDAATWVERLYAGDPQLVQRAAQWLGQFGGAEALEPLRDALTHADAGVRAAAVLALGELGNTAPISDLCDRLLNDGNGMVREAAAQSLGRLREPSAVPALETAAANDAKSKVRKAARTALAQIRARD